nr:immunoglobulin heavy chain junction region [Mus musculus]
LCERGDLLWLRRPYELCYGLL